MMRKRRAKSPEQVLAEKRERTLEARIRKALRARGFDPNDGWHMTTTQDRTVVCPMNAEPIHLDNWIEVPP